MDDVMEQLADSQSMHEFFESCVVGQTLDGDDIFSLKKMVKELVKSGMDEFDARDLFQNTTSINSFPSMETAIIWNDYE
jgi:hypothetical protein